MKNQAQLKEPKQRIAFLNNYRAAVLAVMALLISFFASAQTDSLKYSQINGYGFKYKRMVHDSVFVVPLSTSPHTPYRAGGLRYKAADSTLQIWTGYQWNSIITGVGNGVDTAYALNDSTIAIETPDQDFFVTLPGRYWNLQGVLTNGSTLTTNFTITLQDSLKITSGYVVIDSLRLPALTSRTDTTTYKPLIIDASGNVNKMSSWPVTPGTDTNSLSNRINLKLNISDTTNKWVNDIRRSNDSVYIFKNGSWQFKYIDSTGGSTALAYKNIGFGGINDKLSPGEAAFQYDSITNKLTVDSADHIQSRADSNFLRRLSPYPKSDTSYLIGNSHTVGQGATTSDSAYAYRESSSLSAVPVSVAVSGTGSVSIANRFLTNKNPGNTTAAIAMIGFNDPRRNGLPRKTLNKIINAHKAVFANQYLKSYTNAGTGGVGVTRSGSWTASWSAAAEGGKTTAGAYTSTTNDSISYAFTDSTVIVGLMGGDGSSASWIGTDVDVRFDGGAISTTINTNNQTDGVSDGSGLDNKRCAMAFIFTGLTNASHTITLIKKSTGGGGFMICDYFGHLVDKSAAQLMLWHHIPKMDATGYATAPANATDATTDTVNAKIDSLKTTYPISLYPTYVVPTNSVYNVATDIDPDHIHMANSGHRKIADLAINVVLNSVVPSPAARGAMYYTNEFKGITDDGQRTFSMREDADVRYVRNQSYQTQTGNYNISGTGTANKFTTTGTISGGTLTTTDRQSHGITSGVTSTLPFISIRNNNNSTNAKTFDWFVGSNGVEFRLLSDDLLSYYDVFRVRRNGVGADSIVVPKLDIEGDLRLLSVDSSTGPANMLWHDPITKKIKKTAIPGSITSINSQTGPSITISGDATTGVSASASSNTVTIATTFDIESFNSDANNTGTGETDLYSSTIAANKLTLNGKGLRFRITGTNNDATATAQIKGYFAGTNIFDSGALTMSAAGDWVIDMEIQRTTSTTAAATVTFSCANTTVTLPVKYTALTSQDWTTTNIFKVTGTAGGGGGGSNDITAHAGKVVFVP